MVIKTGMCLNKTAIMLSILVFKCSAITKGEIILPIFFPEKYGREDHLREAV